MMTHLAAGLVLLFVGLDTAAAQSSITFVNATEGSGIDTSIGGIGVSTFDFNSDGYDDLTLALRDAPPALLQNNGDATFTDVTAQMGITSTGIMIAPIWVDVNRDGAPDLYMGHAAMGANALWLNQGDGTFVDVAADWGLNTRARVGAVSFGDFSGDGYPDLFMGVENGFDLLYRNTDGTGFEDVTDAFGVAGIPFSIPMQPTWIDIDEDGDRDLFVTHDEDEPNFLYLNQEGTSFVESAAGWGIREVGAGNSMGVTWGDPDMDGDMDAYVTRIGIAGLYVYDQRINRYVDQATQWRVTLNGVGWGTYFADLDNDGDEDLALVHSSRSGFDPPTLFENQRTWFDPVYTAGDFTQERSDMGLATGDFNNDGRQDLIVVNTRGDHRLMLNTTPDTGNWLSVRLLEENSNPGAIGARLELDVGDDTLVRVLHAGDGYNGQNTYRVHFGLGDATQADELRVRWPDGRWETFGPLEAGARYQILNGQVVTYVESFRDVDQPLDASITVWPNPTQGSVRLSSDGWGGKSLTVQVFDMLGRVVLHNPSASVDSGDQIDLDLSNLQAGVYAVIVSDGRRVWRTINIRE